MAKKSEKYEALVVFSVKNGDEGIPTMIEKFQKLIETHSTLTKTDDWGKRKLAYPINYEKDGWYVLFEFEGDPQFPIELERNFNITESVLRFLVTTRPQISNKQKSKQEEDQNKVSN